MNARRVDATPLRRSVPWPTMMLVRIGTIGSTHGVNVRSSPAPNSERMMSQRLPDIRAAATRSCSGSSMGAASVAPRPGRPGMLGTTPAAAKSGGTGAPGAAPPADGAWSFASLGVSPLSSGSRRPDTPPPGAAPAPVSARAAGNSSETVLVIGG